jgi:hypothetical protein
MASIVVLVAALALLPGSAAADTFFMASLDGGQEVPPNVSTGTGTATVDLNNAGNSISVTLDWQDLLFGAAAATINQGMPSATGPILFNLALGNGAGTTTGSIDPSPQTFSLTSAQMNALKGGMLYIEVDSSSFPAGEIRGQILAIVPEPGSMTLAATAIALGLGGFGWRSRMRRK